MGKFFEERNEKFFGDPKAKDLNPWPAILTANTAGGVGIGFARVGSSYILMRDPQKFLGPKADQMPKDVEKAVKGFKQKHGIDTKIVVQKKKGLLF